LDKAGFFKVKFKIILIKNKILPSNVSLD